jgi:hypothetical protein
VDRECKNNAFENQFKPFYTEPEVLRARAVSKKSVIFKYVLVLCGAILIFGGIERYLVKQHAPEQGVRVWFIEQCI